MYQILSGFIKYFYLQCSVKDQKERGKVTLHLLCCMPLIMLISTKGSKCPCFCMHVFFEGPQ